MWGATVIFDKALLDLYECMLLVEMGVQPPPPPMPDLRIIILGEGGNPAAVLPAQEPDIGHGLATGGAEEHSGNTRNDRPESNVHSSATNEGIERYGGPVRDGRNPGSLNGVAHGGERGRGLTKPQAARTNQPTHFERRRSSQTGLHRLGGSTQAAVWMYSDALPARAPAANFPTPSHQWPSQRRPFDIRCRHINFRFFREGTILKLLELVKLKEKKRMWTSKANARICI